MADVVRQRIYQGDLAPGMPLRQEQLAAALRVSRTPLREALRILEREGLVKVEPGRGVRVITGDLAKLLAAYELREVIDGLAARLATNRRSSALLERLESTLSRQREACEPWNASAYTATNVEFHGAIIAAAHNEFLTADLPILHMTGRIFAPVQRVERSRADVAIGEHAGILGAIADGDAEKAERLARAHIRRTIESLSERPRDGGAVDRHLEGDGR